MYFTVHKRGKLSDAVSTNEAVLQIIIADYMKISNKFSNNTHRVLPDYDSIWTIAMSIISSIFLFLIKLQCKKNVDAQRATGMSLLHQDFYHCYSMIITMKVPEKW